MYNIKITQMTLVKIIKSFLFGKDFLCSNNLDKTVTLYANELNI